ncbi:MAG: HD domain-containing protein [Chloroflexota bacterium]
MTEQHSQHLLTLYQHLLTLKSLPRSGWLQRGVANAESIAGHSFGVAILALLIGETMPHLDQLKLLKIALLHDLAEVHLTDLPTSAKRFIGAATKHTAEQQALTNLLEQFPYQDEYVAIWSEYSEGSSVEARLVKAIDRLEVLAQAFAYERAGNRNLSEFWQNAEQDLDEFPLIQTMIADLQKLREIP